MQSSKVPKHAVIVCHPAPDSFAMAVARRYAETARGLMHQVVIRDLYRMNFDPVLKAIERPLPYSFRVSPDVADEVAALHDADVFVLVYPLWFGTAPAIMKGYIERVFGSGFSADAEHARRPHPFLSGKLLVSFTSSGTSYARLNEHGVLGSLQVFENFLKDVFSLTEASHFHFDLMSERLAPKFVEKNLGKVECETREIWRRFSHNRAL